MPIPARNRWLYPIDWTEVSRLVRFERAKGRCQRCRRPHGRIVLRFPDGRWLDDEAGFWRDLRGRRVATPNDLSEARPTKVRLAACHIDNDPTNNRMGNLRALCQRCHLDQDRDHHLRTYRITINLRRALGDLFDGEYRY